MNADHDRIIAEWMGYEQRRVEYGSCGGAVFEWVWFNKHTFPFPQTAHDICWTSKCPPRYSSSLDAIAEAERQLTDEQFEHYRWILWDNVKDESVHVWTRNHVSATAAQRAAALVAVIQQQKNEN